MIKKVFFYTALLFCSSAFVNLNSTKPKLPREYVYIPAGTFRDGDEQSGKLASLGGYYMSKYEITNQQYKEFLAEVSANLTEAEIEKIKIDSAGWNTIISYCEPMRSNYSDHPVYKNYPVVNVSREGALKYCDWLQQKLQKDNSNFRITVKLPSRLQWTYAAMGGRSFALFPWSGNYMRDKHGKFLCNFNYIDESSIVRNKETGEPEIVRASSVHKHAFTTVNVTSYYPNDFGLYNMSGNAAEMTDSVGICMGGSWLDYGGDVRVTSQAKYDKPSPCVGFRPIIIVDEITKN